MGMSNVSSAKYNVLKDISVGGLSVASGGSLYAASKSFTVSGTSAFGDGASFGAFSDVVFGGAVTLSNSSVSVYKKPEGGNDPFERDYGSLLFAAGANGSGSIENEISGSLTTFRNDAASSSFAGSVKANKIAVEGGRTQTIDGNISHADGVGIVIRDGSALVTSSTVKIDSLSNEGADAVFGNNAGGRNFQDVNIGELRVDSGTRFTFLTDLGSDSLQSDRLLADVLCFEAEMIVFRFSGGMEGEYEIGRFGGMDGYDFSEDPNTLFSYESDGNLEGSFGWNGQTLMFSVTAIPESAESALVCGLLGLAFAAFGARKIRA